jgi:hypothetical protein
MLVGQDYNHLEQIIAKYAPRGRLAKLPHPYKLLGIVAGPSPTVNKLFVALPKVGAK